MKADAKQQRCTKVTFRDEIAARLALAGGAGDKGSTRAYRCNRCRLWHTTSQRRRRRD